MNVLARTVLSKLVITKKLTATNDLVRQPWDLISLEPNPNAMWDAWKTLFMEIVDKHAPLHPRRPRGS